MKIALLTGASSGLGRALAERIRTVFPEIDEVWLIARRADRLAELANANPRFVPVPCDITSDSGIAALTSRVRARGAQIALLVNNAGCGYLGAFAQSDKAEQLRSIDVNVRALTSLTREALAFMPEGARILHTSSIASFSPNPNMAVYSATKAYVTFFSRALNEELRPGGKSSTCVCPAPMNTEFLDVGHVTGHSKMFERLPYCDVNRVALGALKAAKRRKSVYTPRMLYKLYRVLARLLPDAFWIRVAKA